VGVEAPAHRPTSSSRSNGRYRPMLMDPGSPSKKQRE
jgi:hypothetical protein